MMTEDAPKLSMGDRIRELWASAKYGTRHPVRIVLLLAAAGVISGLGETAIIVLLIALASGGTVSLGA